jgi:TPR repeat protein
LFSKLADQNNPIAQYWLADMIELGLGVPRDSAKAIELYKKAAAKNMEAAELRLGEIYLHGDIATPDFAQAKSYLEKAAYHRCSCSDAARTNVSSRPGHNYELEGGLRLVRNCIARRRCLCKARERCFLARSRC